MGLFMMHKTSVKATSNGLDNFLAYQWFALGGSKKGSKDSTFYCRLLQSSRRMTRFYQKALISLALKLIFTRDNKLHGKGSQETAQGPLQCLQHKTTTCCSRQLPCM